MASRPPPPLAGIRVVELAGLAPDFGASVLRIDRAQAGAHTSNPPQTADTFTRNKSSIALDLKRAASKALLLSVLSRADVLIEPFRPGVLEKLGLGPDELLQRNPRLVIARLTGFRRDGKYKDMAGHDINYLAVSGVLSQLGRAGSPPYPPANLLGDFAGGGLMCAYGIVLALLARERSGEGQVVGANMVDGVASLGTMPRLGKKKGTWSAPRGENTLDGGCPFYDTFETQDGGYMAVGALEPQFFAQLVKGLGLEDKNFEENRMDPQTWPQMRAAFTTTFRSKPRKAWEAIFDGTDACCTPVLTLEELEAQGHEIREAVHLSASPGRDIIGQDSYETQGLPVGVGGEDVLREWMGWKRGQHFNLEKGALVQAPAAKL